MGTRHVEKESSEGTRGVGSNQRPQNQLEIGNFPTIIGHLWQYDWFSDLNGLLALALQVGFSLGNEEISFRRSRHKINACAGVRPGCMMTAEQLIVQWSSSHLNKLLLVSVKVFRLGALTGINKLARKLDFEIGTGSREVGRLGASVISRKHRVLCNLGIHDSFLSRRKMK
ncbi:hypothetical protein Tco_1459364 [Tanacetum coccineum]